jgi:hypothetical protein
MPGIRRAVVDSSVLVAYAVESDPFHESSQEVLLRISEWVVPSIVFHEVVWSLRRRVGWKAAQSLAEAILLNPRLRFVPVDGPDVLKGLEDPRKYHDLVVLSVAERLGAPLLTFDYELAKLAHREGVKLVTVRRVGKRGVEVLVE